LRGDRGDRFDRGGRIDKFDRGDRVDRGRGVMGLLGTTKKPTEEGGLLCLMRMIVSK
jgi:hypothetical protein